MLPAYDGPLQPFWRFKPNVKCIVGNACDKCRKQFDAMSLYIISRTFLRRTRALGMPVPGAHGYINYADFLNIKVERLICIYNKVLLQFQIAMLE